MVRVVTGERMSDAHIRLTQDRYAVIDAVDWSLVKGERWRAHRGRNTWYARSSGGEYLHRRITGASVGMIVDHADEDGLNDRRRNLTVAGFDFNAHKSLMTTALSGFRGVRCKRQRWQARINYAGEELRLGMFDTPEEAARAYDAAAVEFYGVFAFTNFGHGERVAPPPPVGDIPF